MTRNRDVDKPQQTTGREFDQALRHAEALLRSADGYRRTVGRYKVLIGFSWGISVIVVALTLAVADGGIVLLLGLFVAALAANLLITSLISSRAIPPLSEMLYRDEQCAVETVGMLRELLPLLSRDEQWSVFRIETARLHLSRFPIKARRRG